MFYANGAIRLIFFFLVHALYSKSGGKNGNMLQYQRNQTLPLFLTWSYNFTSQSFTQFNLARCLFGIILIDSPSSKSRSMHSVWTKMGGFGKFRDPVLCQSPLVTESFTCYMQGALIDINSHDNFSEIETELLPGLARTPNQPGLASSHHLCINT